MHKASNDPVIVWFRRDLRIQNNPALSHAIETGRPVLPVFIHETNDSDWQAGGASRWWLHHSLLSLQNSLAEMGLQLHFINANAEQVLGKLASATGSGTVVWNNLYEPQQRTQDDKIEKALSGYGVQRFDSHLLFTPGSILNKSSEPYRVFTPFWKQARQRLETDGVALNSNPLKKRPQAYRSEKPLPCECSLDELALLDTQPWHDKLHRHWRPGELQAHKQLADFLDRGIKCYDTNRDIPSIDGTSRLSPYMHFGEITPAQIVYQVLQRELGAVEQVSVERLFTELGWREFAHHVLWHFPHTVAQPMNPKFAKLWPRKANSQVLRAWQNGQTGIALVDAGMRQLWETGWMHNRVRMVVGSLLTKNLGIHWLYGARWFWDTLVDADLANNTLGWQWVAGCGVDAAPYYRIFNPDTQATRFDSRFEYIRRWVPEVDDLSENPPIIDLKTSREEALRRYKALPDVQ